MRLALPLLMLFLAHPAAAAPYGHLVTLWVAEGLGNRVYLLGSVHLLREQDHPLPAVIEEVYDDAESLVMELDMDDLDVVAMQSAINRLGVISDERTLKDLMGDELYGKASAAAEKLDIPLELLDKSEPWLAALTVEQLALSRIGFNALHGIEMHISAKAVEDGKPIEGLESIEEQLELLDGLSLEAQRALLLQTLEEGSDIGALMDELILAWRHGDTAFLEDTLLADFARYPELYRAIVVERNLRWVDRIDALLDDAEDYLVVVGALHLVGDEGVPELLGRRGVTVRQLRESPR